MEYKIIAKNECRYLSEVLDELPKNCLLDKGVTGCGGTTLALNDKMNTIIVAPNVSMVISKDNLNDHRRDVVKYDVMGVMGGIDKEEISKYISTHSVLKFVVTYDSFEKLVHVISKCKSSSFLNSFFILVDEWHDMFNYYAFRNKAIRSVLSTVYKFKCVTYMTATPINNRIVLKELMHLDRYIIEWPGYKNMKVIGKHVNKPLSATCDFIKKSLKCKFNLHIFVNSVKFIELVIRHTGLTKEDIRIICSNDKKNIDLLNKQDLVLNSIKDPVKKINFYTASCFAGSDIMDNNGLILVVSDTYRETTLVDISTRLIQICGRIRNYSKNHIYHIFSTSRYNQNISYEDFERECKDRFDKDEKFCSIMNSNNDLNQRIVSVKDSYIRIEIEKGKNPLYVADINFMNMDINNYCVKDCYKTRLLYKQELDKNGIENEINFWKVESVKKPKQKTFKKLYSEYVNSKNIDYTEVKDDIEKHNPLFKQIYDNIDYEDVIKLQYSKDKILQLLNFKLHNKTIVSDIESKIQYNVNYTLHDIKNILSESYKKFNISKTAKATDMNEYFNVKNKISGSTRYMIILNKL